MKEVRGGEGGRMGLNTASIEVGKVEGPGRRDVVWKYALSYSAK